MRISLNEIKKLVRIPEGVTDEELIERIGSRLVEIEEAIDLAPQYEGVYIIKVVKCEPIEGTHLHLCQIDAGEAGVKWAGEDDFVQVVCGAPNVHAGMLAVWITPGAIVPETYGNENFKLSVRKLQGHESYGMLAGADELGLDNEHKAIAEIDPKMARPGDCFADVFELDDIILDVENKSLTHRPDCFGLIGFAREVAGILGVKFEEPEWIGDKGEALASEDMVLNASQSSATKRRGSNEASATGVLSSSEKVARGSNEALATGALSLLSKDSGWSGSESLDEESSTHKDKNQLPKLFITIADPTLCPRYSCAVFDLANNEPSKFLTREAIFLAKAGMRAIDPLVDLTNIIMLQTGQPLHAFDYDKLVAVGGKDEAKIIVRGAKEGEELQLLDGETIKCISEDILITSNDVPVALAGAMGGKNTEIDASTKRVVLESATFSLYNLRKTQMAHGIFSEAITRFTKGQPAAMTLLVLGEAVRRAGVEPEIVKDEWGKESEPIVVKITTSAINQLLGTDHSTDEIVKTLENVGFKVSDYEQKFKKSKKLGPV